MLDIALEGIAVDGAVEHKRRDEASQGQRANECCGLPMAMRHPDPEPLAPRASTMAARHVGGSPGLVDEHEALRLEIELPIKPVAAASQDVGAVLLRGMGRLFLRVMPLLGDNQDEKAASIKVRTGWCWRVAGRA